MSEFYLHFYSKTICNVFINGELIGTIDNEKQFYIDVIVSPYVSNPDLTIKLDKDGIIFCMVSDGKIKIIPLKEGIVNIAKLSGVPIVPVAWVSNDKTFLKFNSWDEFRVPFGFCRTVVVYGEPMYVPSDITKDQQKEWCQKVADELNKVGKDARENCDKYWKDKSIKKLGLFEL